MALPMASSAKVVTFGGFKSRADSFRVAGVALCDIPTCFITCRKSLCVAGAILLRRFQKMSCSFRGRCSTWAALWRPPSSFCVAGAAHQATRRVACFLRIPLSGLRQVMSTCQLRGKCGTSWESHSAKQAQHFAKIHPVWKSLLHFTLHTLHFTLHTPHCRLLYSTLYTLHSTLHTLHSTVFTLHSSLHTLHSTLRTLHFTLTTVHFTLHTSHSTLYTPHSTL